MRAGSNHSSISVEDVDSSPADPQIIGRARALVDFTPTPYDKDALKFKVGIQVRPEVQILSFLNNFIKLY